MATNPSEPKKPKIEGKPNPFVGAIKYKNDLPDPPVGCKFLPCGKTLMDYSVEPVSFPQLESNYTQDVKGLHNVLDIDLLTPKLFLAKEEHDAGMDDKDAELLTDIEPLHIDNPKPKPVNAGGRDLFTRERYSLARPRSHLQHLQAEPEVELEPLSLEEEKQLINQTFVDILKPIGEHPTKVPGKLRPVLIQPVFPHPKQLEFVQIHFGVPPTDNKSSLLKNCGNYLINYRNAENVPIEKPDNMQTYVSDQRYKEERTSDISERGEPLLLQDGEGAVYYQLIKRNMKLRKERPNAQSNSNISVLQVTYEKGRTEQ